MMRILYFIVLSLLGTSLFAQKERILNFDTQIEVHSDRSITVIEFIEVYASGDRIKRGITRSLPLRRMLNEQETRMHYDIVQVERDGKKESYKEESNGGHKILYLGKSDVFLEPGVYSYKIEYDVANQIGEYENYDEIYWNAIGTDVVFDVEQASCRVRVPGGAKIVQQDAYTGAQGSREKGFTVREEGSSVDYRLNRSLGPGEGFTVAVGFEKGFLEEPSIFQRMGSVILVILGGLFLLPYYVYTWWKYGQDPPTPASYPIFHAPDGLSAASLNFISKEKYQASSFTASIIHLAISGFLRIEEAASTGLIFKKKSYLLVKTKEADDSMIEEERRLFNALFAYNDEIRIDGEYEKRVEEAYQMHNSSLSNQHHSFITAGHNMRFLWIPVLFTIVVGGLAIFLMLRSPFSSAANMISVMSFIPVSILTIVLYNYLIKKPTEDKLELKSRIKGYKMYLEMAEKDRLNLLNPPEMTPVHFEEALPYAFALGVEHVWSTKFKRILEDAQYRPDWNRGTPIYMSNSFGRSFNENVSGSATKPSESGSGSGGGGFSGGGGGGGGVGGW